MALTRMLIMAGMVLVLVTATSAAFAARAGDGGGETFVAVLSGDNEVPGRDTHARGVAIVRVSADGTSLSWRLIVANIDDAVAAHIHCGTAGLNGPVVVGLYGGPATSDSGILSTGSADTVIPRSDSAACPGGIATFADLLAKMRSGGAYVNVHTVVFPGGEIRGQLVSSQ